MKQRAYLFRFAGALLFWSLLIFNSCGIYTTTAPLNPPFAQSMDSANLYFAGYNGQNVQPVPEDWFAGYNLYYKREINDYYKVCAYKQAIPYPTIPEQVVIDGDTNYIYFEDKTSEDPPRIEFTINIENLYPQEDFSRSFYELHEDEQDRPQFFFAVSAVGDEDEESERIEFGAWPTPATQ